MTMETDIPRHDDLPVRKPRLALMGEFSAGKSTLSNILLGARPLPTKVTATRLPPIWIADGDGPAMREDNHGNLHEIDIDDLESVDLEDTRLIRLYLKADILTLCDLIDMPGISDPNMGAEMWQNVIGEADHVIWCSHATQAWRQSEAAVWGSLPESLRDRSILLLTRFDKIQPGRDRDRVLTRVKRETKGLFSDLFPISLTEALIAGDDDKALEDCGAKPFVMRLVELLVSPASPPHGTYGPPPSRQEAGEAGQVVAVPEDEGDHAAEEATVRVMPSRVRARTGAQRTPRGAPRSASAAAGLADAPGNV